MINKRKRLKRCVKITYYRILLNIYQRNPNIINVIIQIWKNRNRKGQSKAKRSKATKIQKLQEKQGVCRKANVRENWQRYKPDIELRRMKRLEDITSQDNNPTKSICSMKK